MGGVGHAAAHEKAFRDRGVRFFHISPLGFSELTGVDSEAQELIPLQKSRRLVGGLN
jgi:hypothetical protein